MGNKIALIDADSIIHIVSYLYKLADNTLDFTEELEDKDKVLAELYETLDKEAVKAHIKSFINDILNSVNATHYLGFLGHRDGSNTFRHRLAVTKPYKGNRKTTPHWVKFWKPIMVEYMVEEWGFIELSEIEADDACSICQRNMENTIICSPDKDLKQVPGEHYDYKKCEFTTITELEGAKRLYIQSLVGDGVDNISGCPNVGEKSKYVTRINEASAEEEMVEIVLEAYESKGALAIYPEQLALVTMLVEECDNFKLPQPIERQAIGLITDLPIQETTEVELPTFTQ